MFDTTSLELEPKRSINKFFAKIFLLMAAGVLLSAIAGYAVLHVPTLFRIFHGLAHSRFGVLFVLGIQLIIVFAIRGAISSRKTGLALFLFFLYATTLSFTFATVLLVFSTLSIAKAFVGAVVLFVCLAIIGFTTKADLLKFRTLFFVALISLIVLSFVNIFLLKSSGFDLFISYLGLFIFLGLTAYDMQKLKTIYYHLGEDKVEENAIVVMGALELYLDFINIFLFLLRIFGRND